MQMSDENSTATNRQDEKLPKMAYIIWDTKRHCPVAGNAWRGGTYDNKLTAERGAVKMQQMYTKYGWGPLVVREFKLVEVKG